MKENVFDPSFQSTLRMKLKDKLIAYLKLFSLKVSPMSL